MSEIQSVDETESKKRKPETSLSDLKKQQLSDARARKQEKAAQKAQELELVKDGLGLLKQRVSQTEEKLKQTDQKLDNNEVDKEVQKEISEKKQKVIVAEKDVIPERKWKLENFEMPLRLALPILFAVGSFCLKNMLNKEPVMTKTSIKPSKPQETVRQVDKRPDFFSQSKPWTSLFKFVS